MPAIYNTIGDTYSQTRRADERIANRIIQLLNIPVGSRILDIGAGTGSYSYALADSGFEVTALEPSTTMSDQAEDHVSVSWITGSAEELPFDSASFDAVILILCIHHFSDLSQALQEAQRVTGEGPVLIFTYDPDAIKEPWLFEYFPIFQEQIIKSFPSTSVLASHFLHRSEVTCYSFPLPHDLKDSFAGSAWRYPERYLDKEFRDGTSAFRQLDSDTCKLCLGYLHRDLESGEWDSKHSNVRTLSEYDHGYTFILATHNETH